MNIIKTLKELLCENRPKKSGGKLPEVTKYPPMPEVTQSPKQISEPVLSLLETMKEEGRWESYYFENTDPEYPVLTVIDGKTSTTFKLHPHKYYRFSYELHNCDWLTSDEQDALKIEMWRLRKDKQEAKKREERQKMVKIYCKGTEQ